MSFKKTIRQPPNLGDINERIFITDKNLKHNDLTDLSFLSNTQAQWFKASIVNFGAIAPANYTSKNEADVSDTRIWIRSNLQFMPSSGNKVYYPMRKYGQEIDYVYLINQLGVEYYSRGLLELICRTDIINDRRLQKLNKLTPSNVPHQ